MPPLVQRPRRRNGRFQPIEPARRRRPKTTRRRATGSECHAQRWRADAVKASDSGMAAGIGPQKRATRTRKISMISLLRPFRAFRPSGAIHPPPFCLSLDASNAASFARSLPDPVDHLRSPLTTPMKMITALVVRAIDFCARHAWPVIAVSILLTVRVVLVCGDAFRHDDRRQPAHLAEHSVAAARSRLRKGLPAIRD